MQMQKKTIGLISLGCDKNRVDSEKMLACLLDKYNVSNDVEKCQILIVNSCAFLESSRKESIDMIFEYAHLKKDGNLEKIVLTGCLPQKFIDELFDELTEVDVFLGTFDYSLICEAIEQSYLTGERINCVGKGKELGKRRLLTTESHYAYLKIADGCNNHCTYCLIPKIRGKYKSYPIDELVEEARGLGDLNELILVAQDVTFYGEDEGKNKLCELVDNLSKLDNVKRIRLLYCYPERLTDEMIEMIATNEKVIKYVDVPLQHADDRILKLMNRKGSFESYLALVEKLKSRIPNIAIRSTFITGFPSETEAEHERLKEFLKKAQLFNAGFFAYSREAETPSYKLKGQLEDNVKQRRLKELYAEQKKIASGILKNFIGKDLTVVCDGIDYEKQMFKGRAYFNAPTVDGLVYFKSSELVNQGEEYQVHVEKVKQYDLYGEVKQ